MTQSRRIDLHVHSTASDGTFSPSEVVGLALELGLDVIALTDHDTLDGIDEAKKAAENTPLEVVSGIELSCEGDVTEVHILGYFVENGREVLESTLQKIRDVRFERARKIVEKLAALGVPVPFERVQEIAGGEVIGRPHIAQALVEAGHVTSTQEAFDKYIANDGPAYVPRYRLTPSQAVDLIHRAGGVAVLAHPVRINYRKWLPELIEIGIDGVEAYYPEHPPSLVQWLEKFAAEHRLIVTGGSDFHHLDRDGFAILGRVSPPADCVDKLRERANGARP